MLAPGCALVGTSQRRAARLQRGAKGDDLVPVDVLEEKKEDFDASQRPKSMRVLTERPVDSVDSVDRADRVRYMGVLNGEEKTLELLDMENGGSKGP